LNILAIETSGVVASVAIAKDENILCEYMTNEKLNHSVTLMPMIQEAFNRVSIEPEQLDLIAVSSGPGSFTGLRIGGATAKGLAHALNIPIASIPTLDALAHNISYTDRLICPMIDARRKQVYTAIYKYEEDKIIRITEMMAVKVEEIITEINQYNKPVIFIGDGYKECEYIIKEKIKTNYSVATSPHNLQRASIIANLGLVYAKEDKLENYLDYAPIYLKKSQAEREYEKRKKDV